MSFYGQVLHLAQDQTVCESVSEDVRAYTSNPNSPTSKMSLPLAWEEDREALLTMFRARAEELGPLQQNRPFPIHIFEWQHGEPKGKKEMKHSVDDLRELGNAAIRVM
jgi:hypothetical protein